MDSATERQMLRLLLGELPPRSASQLRQRLAREPELGAYYQKLERVWQGLELPPNAPLPWGATQRLMHRVTARRNADQISWKLAPTWARAGGAAALIFGVIVGASVGPREVPSGELSRGAETLAGTASAPATPATTTPATTSDLGEPLSLAEGYWLALGEDLSTLTEEGAP